MKWFITGSAGQLGNALIDCAIRNNIAFCGVDREDLDLSDRTAVNKAICESGADIVIHAAAFTSVDTAEDCREEAYESNVTITQCVSDVCHELSIPIVFISTDYIFDGKKDGNYDEDDRGNPLNVYGETKLSAEKYIIENNTKYYIVRTSWMFGRGTNFVKTIRRLASQYESINVVSDQFGSPTYAADLAVIIKQLVGTGKYGVYHAHNEGSCSWADFASEIIRQSGIKCSVMPVLTEKYGAKADRPRNSVMSMNKLKLLGISDIPTWQDALSRYLKETEKMGEKNYRVAVTGAGGYIGRLVVKCLLDNGYEVIALNLSSDGIDKRAECICCDIFNCSDEILDKTAKADCVIHLAWQDGFIHNSDSHLRNLYSHYHFIEELLSRGLKHIAVMGTMHEVGYWEGAIDENTPTRPLSLYGVAKNALRQACGVMMKKYPDVTFQWLRAFYIFGDDLKNNSIFTKLVKAAGEGKKTFSFTSGKNLYDFISVYDLARQVSAAAVQTEISGIINCCTGNPISLAERVEAFIKENNLDIKLEYGAFPDRDYDSPGVWGDNKKIRKIMEKTNMI